MRTLRQVEDVGKCPHGTSRLMECAFAPTRLPPRGWSAAMQRQGRNAAHMSAMSGVPTLTLQSATNHPHQWGPIGANAHCMSLDVPCGRCHILDLSQCSHGFRCMLDLTPEMVLRQALTMLATPREQLSRNENPSAKENQVELLG